MKTINKPQDKTYWIAYTDTTIFAYGEVESTQQMTTGQPYLFQTTDRLIWSSKLINDFNTDPDDKNLDNVEANLDNEIR